uniref:PDZ domain-containing protein n=1 Tax=Aureoumbra lagunensis TaxID=44058 RepID=A0A6S8CAI9_9STRA|mmetsp:Transcript_8749/g.12148  ORF Transcript_8749/g.12148 Transcript_8749/m.12148 type:complete len:644 (+) Transcript_8749:60-1991(+)|eukprot:CAMPEP_0197322548 /NCGR_PEP_ID=MMETSP0891-20130614/69968_1 /TAXON_ID=44058 ORGANISM="Aureoumbra lagunensis, Strain CCMP1510" /NCGR_SAMPLE_ID=MMETSP0891 /ASSEMBLY_ACC=CAM_ASM_000534 /LENGTH=643 /DNA_ID=CAMNT_0042814977 /DNA_START=76 /DNA_END=2007 /DNA_ORIENTATION=+
MEESESEEEIEPRLLKDLVQQGMMESPVFWIREFKDPDSEISAQQLWNAASSQARIQVAKWIRSWKEEENVEHLKEVMGCLDGILYEVFESEAAEGMRRWTAAVLLDVFSEKEDLAVSFEMLQKPKFDKNDISLSQFDRLTAFEDLWSGEGSRAEELADLILPEVILADGEILDDVHIVLTRWIVAVAMAELYHLRAKTESFSKDEFKEGEQQRNQSAREMLIAKANAIRDATVNDESDDSDNEWQEEDNDEVIPSSSNNTNEEATLTVSKKDEEEATLTVSKNDEEETFFEGTKNTKLLPPQRMGPRKKTVVGEHYETNDVEMRRHERGYDVLDTEMQQVSQDDKKKARLLLIEHVDAMAKAGLVFELEIHERKLGLSVSLARFGKKGRRFVIVDSSDRSEVKAGDELVSVNQAYIVNPSDESIPQLIRFVDDAPRPVILKFIKGEGAEDEERNLTTTSNCNKHQQDNKVLLAIYDSAGLPKLQCSSDGRVTKFHSYQRNTKHKGRLAGFFTSEGNDFFCADQKGILLGSLKISPSDPSQAELFDDQDRVVAYCDLGSLKLTDTRRTTKFQIDLAGAVRGHDGLHCATVTDFHPNSHFKLVALISTFLVRDLFDPPGKRPASVARIVRKTSAKMTGIHGFFG